ncbi:uncharacterized protein LOC130726775 isoform X2 [Lotus japonicus]|uniref:uncharacterized protein LOC130726775 isoform X2 n=1 Tax=Lotus japonicus TaxID=34305 RepID=UPI0025881829|nr:uncharacterized protein LOC130726775 isoform X2 [Lotus japonicus]
MYSCDRLEQCPRYSYHCVTPFLPSPNFTKFYSVNQFLQNSGSSTVEEMVPSNAPKTYYSSIHNSITSLCKTILPVGFNKRHRLVSAEHKLQSDNLKWQQDTLHQLLNLMALHRDDILPEAEVSAFKAHLLETLLACPHPQRDYPLILRDKIGFLQELLDAKCISEGEYHSSRRPLLQRLAAQGGEIGGRDVMVVAEAQDREQNSEEEWSVIDLKDDQCLMNKENSNSNKKKTRKNFKGAFSFGSSNKHGKHSKEKSIFDSPSLQMHSAHSKIPSSTIYANNETRHAKDSPLWDGPENFKRKPFGILFHREKKEGHSGGDQVLEPEGRTTKKQWGFKGFEKLRKNDLDDETAPLSLLMENKLHLHSDVSPSEFSISDKVSEDKINKEVSIIQTELRSTNTNAKFSNDQIQAISTEHPENKPELKKHFPNVVLDAVKENVGEKENMRNHAEEKYESTMGWTTFEDDENLHPNLFAHQDNSLRSSSINPFSQWN